MRLTVLALAAALAGGAWNAAQAQTPLEPRTALEFMTQIAALKPAPETQAICDRTLAGSATLNGPTLFYGSAACLSSERKVDGAFLQGAGQIRSMADIGSALGGGKPPGDDEEGRAVTALYAAIYSYLGGSGPTEIYRDPASRGEFMGRLERWQPQTPADYNPGWPPVAFTRDAAQAGLAEQKAYRLKQLGELSRLISDDAYYAASEELDALQRAQKGPFISGTPAFARLQELRGVMNARRQVLLGSR